MIIWKQFRRGLALVSYLICCALCLCAAVQWKPDMCIWFSLGAAACFGRIAQLSADMAVSDHEWKRH